MHWQVRDRHVVQNDGRGPRWIVRAFGCSRCSDAAESSVLKTSSGVLSRSCALREGVTGLGSTWVYQLCRGRQQKCDRTQRLRLRVVSKVIPEWTSSLRRYKPLQGIQNPRKLHRCERLLQSQRERGVRGHADVVAPKKLMRQTESALFVRGHARPSRLASARLELAGIVASQFLLGTAVVSWAANVIVNSKQFPTTYNTRSCTGGALLEGGGMTVQIVACSVEENKVGVQYNQGCH